jgi:hypothetical protein
MPDLYHLYHSRKLANIGFNNSTCRRHGSFPPCRRVFFFMRALKPVDT